jgi:hypothetical protein
VNYRWLRVLHFLFKWQVNNRAGSGPGPIYCSGFYYISQKPEPAKAWILGKSPQAWPWVKFYYIIPQALKSPSPIRQLKIMFAYVCSLMRMYNKFLIYICKVSYFQIVTLFCRINLFSGYAVLKLILSSQLPSHVDATFLKGKFSTYLEPILRLWNFFKVV